ncbi:MAG: Oxidoreductase [Variovorax sp.]|nr:Oxidoreductase [Variovorax sp.]
MTPGPCHSSHRVLVVGGVGDIGAAIVRAFLEAGSDVVATGVDATALTGTSLQPHKRLRLATLDVTSDAQVAEFVSGLGTLHTLVNCAGILARFKEFDVATFQRVLDVNLTGTFRLCNACKPLLAVQGGCIVNIASMNAFVALPAIPAYCASKGGVVMLTKSLALAWAADGVRVNAVAPGYVETAINAEGRQDLSHYERIRSRIPQGRWAQPDDIAGSVVFLASKSAHYITGTVLAVDGGFLAG